jgi:hypothetical protein
LTAIKIAAAQRAGCARCTSARAAAFNLHARTADTGGELRG